MMAKFCSKTASSPTGGGGRHLLSIALKNLMERKRPSRMVSVLYMVQTRDFENTQKSFPR